MAAAASLQTTRGTSLRARDRGGLQAVLMAALFDAHNHLHLPQEGKGAAELVARAQAAGVSRAAVCSTSTQDWAVVASLRAEFPEFVRAQYGIHPWWLTEQSADQPFAWAPELRARLEADPTAGVGETGLDKSRRSTASLAAQKRACVEHLRVARDLRRPVTLHCVRAYGSLLELLERFARDECRGELPTCVLHGFRGPPDLVVRFARLGCSFSFGGHPLDAAHLELIRSVPRERLLLETDAPDQLPPGAVLGSDRGGANEPANLAAIAAHVAAALAWSVDDLASLTSANAHAIFSLPSSGED